MHILSTTDDVAHIVHHQMVYGLLVGVQIFIPRENAW